MKIVWTSLLVVVGAAAVLLLIAFLTWKPAPPDVGPEHDATALGPGEPEHILRVNIVDALPLDYYVNTNDRVCDVGMRTMFMVAEQASITIRDASGQVIASELAPARGGEFQKGAGCVVVLEVGVPTSEFYEVEVAGGSRVQGEPPRNSMTRTVKSEAYSQAVVFNV